MNILVTTGDFSHYLVPNFYNLLMEASQYVDLQLWYEPGDINEILSHLDTRPDLIFINEFGETNSPAITGLESLQIPYALLLYDLHYKADERRSLLSELHPQFIFSHYRDQFIKNYPEFEAKMIWLPHHVDTQVFKDYGLAKDIDCLLMGETNARVYPLRAEILSKMQGRPGFVYHEHPGWRNFSAAERESAFVGVKYAREINRAKIFLTCDSIYKYPLLKYYEVLACGTLLLASTSGELADLGFIAGENFVDIDDNNFIDKVEYYLVHENERREIAQRGYDMIRARHTTSQRAIEFVQTITNGLKSDQDYIRREPG